MEGIKMKLLIIIIIFSGFSCDFGNKPEQLIPPIKEIVTDTIKDPILKTDCSLTLENTTVKVQASNFPNSTGNAIVRIIIDTFHTIKEIKLELLTIVQNKKIIFKSSENLENENVDQLTPIIAVIKNTIYKGKIICIDNMKSSTTLFIPFKLILK